MGRCPRPAAAGGRSNGPARWPRWPGQRPCRTTRRARAYPRTPLAVIRLALYSTLRVTPITSIRVAPKKLSSPLSNRLNADSSRNSHALSLTWGLSRRTPGGLSRPDFGGRRLGSGGRSRPDQAAVGRVVLKQLAQLPASAMQSRHHRADRRGHDVGDLLVGEAFHVGQVDRDAELLGEGLQGTLDIGIGQPLQRLRLG